MKEIFPSYYSSFRCIADKCKHSCCIGWEIDIDNETMALYNSLDGDIGEKIRENIEGDIPHFILKDDERCPFLSERGLCDIICELGEGALCDICYLHPRFSNVYQDFMETGLGLSCEEAARVILTEEEKFFIPLPESAKNDPFFKEREEVFGILQNRSAPFSDRLKRLAERYDVRLDFSGEELYEMFSSLERLDGAWEMALEKLGRSKSPSIFEREDMQVFFEQLSCYFVFRHFNKGGGLPILSVVTIGAICSECEIPEEMLEVVRMYSSEIEYSEENTDKLISYLDKN